MEEWRPVPDLPELVGYEVSGGVIGWRMWMQPPLRTIHQGRLQDGVDGWLYGPGGAGSYHRRWDGPTMEADCPQHRQPPTMAHSDGIHASNSMRALLLHPDLSREMLRSAAGYALIVEKLVFGRVLLSGKLLPGVERRDVLRGQRGEILGPLYMCGRHELAEEVGQRYGVEVVPVRLDQESWRDGVFRAVLAYYAIIPAPVRVGRTSKSDEESPLLPSCLHPTRAGGDRGYRDARRSA